MTVWIALAALTVAVLALLLHPLLRSRPAVAADEDFDLAVYRDQLKEVDRDVERGLLTAGQAQAARTEIQRRILAAADHRQAARPAAGATARRALAAAVVVLVPLGGFGLYALLGAPELPAQPFAEREQQRLAMSGEDAKHMIDLVERLAQRMKDNPADMQGWLMLARSYQALGRHEDSVNAYRRAVRLGASDASTMASFGESMIMAGQGEVGPEARQALTAALAGDAAEPRARFYLGLAKMQDGEPREALAIWRDLEKDTPDDAPWLATLRERIQTVANELGVDPASIEPRAPAVDGHAALAAAAPAAGETQDEVVRGMVEGLAAKLAENPGDFDGWMRLGRSYQVLGETDKAIEAYGKAVALKPQEADPRLALAEAQLSRVPEGAPLPADFVETMRAVQGIAPDNIDALYFVGLAEAQAGRPEQARELWTRVMNLLPPDAPGRGELQAQIDALGKKG